MIILQAKGLAQRFGAVEIFSGIEAKLHVKERVGLVGPNGCGKTTLLQILAGLQTPSAGEVSRAPGLTLGYLQQEAALTFSGRENTVFAEMLSVFADLRQMEVELRRMEEAMAAGEADEGLFGEYGRIQSSYEMGGGYQYQHEIKRVLQGLGLAPDEWQTPLTQLSGGQKTRVLLGRLLLEVPDLLILDEPTNHLDVTAVEWLERTLRIWNGTLLIVSHDRYFLDRITSHIWELSPTRLRRYKGNYTTYRQQRQLEEEREAALFRAEKARLESELAFIRKNIAGGKSDIAKGKLKRLTREIVLIEQVGVAEMQSQSWLKVGERARTFSVNEAEKRIRELPAPASRTPDLKVRLMAEQRGSERVVTSKRLQIGWPGRPLFEADDIRLERLDCAALIGPNGSGKSTLLRTLMGEIRPLRGKLRLGDEVTPGYFAQAHEQLNVANRAIDEVLAHKPMSETAARRHLARYLFRGDDVFKRVSSLSGGERGRLALALLALDEANLLLLDEPTNHLDIPSQEILQTALERYDGTIVLVSHDRYLVDRLATQIWEIRDGRMRIFAGTYQEFLAAREGGDTAVVSKVSLPTEEKDTEPVDLSWLEGFEPPPVSRKDRKEHSRRRRELIEQIEETEAWLAQLAYDIVRARRAKDDTRWQELRREQAIAQAELEALSAELDEVIG